MSHLGGVDSRKDTGVHKTLCLTEVNILVITYNMINIFCLVIAVNKYIKDNEKHNPLVSTC